MASVTGSIATQMVNNDRTYPLLKRILHFLDDILLLAGCGCVLFGLSMWSIPITWIVAGLMLGGWAALVGKQVKEMEAKDVT